MDLSQAFYDFFARRIAERGLYGPMEYIVYGAIMLGLAFFVIFPILDRRGIKFNAKFMLALLPYILLGSALRVLEDMALLPRSWNPLEPAYYFVTPGIYLLVAAVALAALCVSRPVSKRLGISFHKTFATIGLALALPILLFEALSFQALAGFIAVFAMAFLLLPVAWVFLQLSAPLISIIISAINHFLRLIAPSLRLNFDEKLWKGLLKNRLNLLAVFSQVLDGSATFVATQFFWCGEQHPLSGYLLDLFPLSFVAVKAGLVLLILHYVDTNIKNENLRGFIKVVVAVLGFATGLRDVLTLGVGTCL
jgi:uncharacterized membrane protein